MPHKSGYGSSSRHRLSQHKAQEIISDGTVHGHSLTKKQKKFMQAVAHGMVPNAEIRRGKK